MPQMSPNGTQPANGFPSANDAYTTGITNAYKMMKKRFAQLLRSQKFLKQQLEQATQANITIRSELQNQQEIYNRLVEKLGRISSEKSQMHEDFESQKFQKELNELILDQYRDEVLESKSIIGEKDRHIETCTESITAAYGEIAALKAQISYMRQRMCVGEEDIRSLRCQLESSIGESRRQEMIAKGLRKERNDAMDGCMYYQKQIGRLKMTYDDLENRVNALAGEHSPWAHEGKV
ncbi:hypothetical protein ACJ41O_005836 [Fusarium nematophilum]